MPTSAPPSRAVSSPLRVSLIRTSRIAVAAYGDAGRTAPGRSEGPVAADRRLVGAARLPGGGARVGRRHRFAPGAAGARLDLVLGGAAGALLALFRLLADPVGLGLELVPCAAAGLLLGFALELRDQGADALLGFAADVLGALHDALLDLGL